MSGNCYVGKIVSEKCRQTPRYDHDESILIIIIFIDVPMLPLSRIFEVYLLTVPALNILFVGTVPALKVLFVGTLPAYNAYSAYLSFKCNISEIGISRLAFSQKFF